MYDFNDFTDPEWDDFENFETLIEREIEEAEVMSAFDNPSPMLYDDFDNYLMEV